VSSLTTVGITWLDLNANGKSFGGFVTMNLLFRLFIVAVAALFHGPRPLLCASHLRLRVMPNDLDLNLHMNNARYLSVFDLGKIDVMIRSGVASIAYRRRWRPLIGGNIVRYRFGLRPFCRFQLITRVVCWDDKWFYFQHEVETKQGVAAFGLSKALLREVGRSVPPVEVMAAVAPGLSSPSMPPIIAEWLSLDEALRSDQTGGSEPL
jgi:acyl-CoA thioesterase FadM